MYDFLETNLKYFKLMLIPSTYNKNVTQENTEMRISTSLLNQWLSQFPVPLGCRQKVPCPFPKGHYFKTPIVRKRSHWTKSPFVQQLIILKTNAQPEPISPLMPQSNQPNQQRQESELR